MLLKLQQAKTWTLAAALGMVLGLGAAPQERLAELDGAAKAEVSHSRFDLAEKLYQRSLEARREKFGENSAEYAAGLVNLAGVYGATRFWARTGAPHGSAEDLYARALAIQEAALGANHPDVADTLYHLANYAQGRKKLETALALYQRVLDI